MECAKTKIGQFQTVRVRVCAKCGEVIDKGRKKKNVEYKDEVTRQLKLKDAHPVYDEDFTAVEYDTHAGRLKQDIVVLSDKFQCLDCGRSGSQYFEAIIQLRGGKEDTGNSPVLVAEPPEGEEGAERSTDSDGGAKSRARNEEKLAHLSRTEKKMQKLARLLIKRIESRSFIPKIEELREGLDIYCGSRNEAIAALNSYQLGFVRTEKLAGEKNGKRLYRTTLLVRL